MACASRTKRLRGSRPTSRRKQSCHNLPYMCEISHIWEIVTVPQDSEWRPMLAFLTKYKSWAVGVVLVAITLAVIGHYVSIGKTDAEQKAQAALQTAQTGLHTALADATKWDQAIVAQTRRADSLGAIAVRTTKEAIILQHTVPGLRARLDSVLTDSTQRRAAARLFGAMQAGSDSFGVALQAQTAESVILRQSLDSARTSVVQVVHAAITVDSAATAGGKAYKVPFLLRIAPNPGIGAAGGFHQTGETAAGG